jgi:hypothetical protein
MTASIWTEMGAAYLAWALLIVAIVAVWAVFVFFSWIGRGLESLIGKWSRGHREKHNPWGGHALVPPGVKMGKAQQFVYPPQWEPLDPLPFDQEKD